MQDWFWNISCRCTNVHYTWLLILNITQTMPAFQLLLQLTSSLLTAVLLIIMLHIYEIDYVLWNNRLLIWIVILNATENSIIFLKATEYSFTIFLCSIYTDLASFWKTLTIFYSLSIRQQTFWPTVLLFQQELKGIPFLNYLMHVVYMSLVFIKLHLKVTFNGRIYVHLVT